MDRYRTKIAARGANVIVNRAGTPYRSREFNVGAASGLPVVFGPNIG